MFLSFFARLVYRRILTSLFSPSSTKYNILMNCVNLMVDENATGLHFKSRFQISNLKSIS